METSNSGANHAVLQAQRDRWGVGPIVTINSGHIDAVVSAQNHRWRLGHMETCTSGAKVAVLNAKNDRWGLGPIETCDSGPKDAVLHAKTTNEGWDPERLVILMLITLFCMHRMTSEVWDTWRLCNDPHTRLSIKNNVQLTMQSMISVMLMTLYISPYCISLIAC